MADGHVAVVMRHCLGCKVVTPAEKENPAEAGLSKSGRGAGIRTPEWRDQNPLPYRLATPLQQTVEILLAMVRKKRLELLHLAALEPKSSASTNFATSASAYWTEREWWLQRESNLRPQHYECCALTS